MTWVDYSEYVTSTFLHPRTWKKQIDELKPDLLFCESAWCGIDQYPNCWRGRVYKDRRLYFENRRELLSIIEYCKEHGIKTVFWNKEDPVYFQHKVYDFTETTLLFDYIFTTAIECVEKYKSLGHKNVYLMPFGVNISLFNNQNRDISPNTVVFAGSWFSDQPKRCEDLQKILDFVIDKGWKLDIYDRKSESKSPKFRFPAKYKEYIRKAVPYSSIPALCKKYEYAINVNTVTESETMFSRRMLQMLSCGLRVITNTSIALPNLHDILHYEFITDEIIMITGKNQLAYTRYSTKNQMIRVIDITIKGTCQRDMEMK